jgi:hypothetical protein
VLGELDAEVGAAALELLRPSQRGIRGPRRRDRRTARELGQDAVRPARRIVTVVCDVGDTRHGAREACGGEQDGGGGAGGGGAGGGESADRREHDLFAGIG